MKIMTCVLLVVLLLNNRVFATDKLDTCSSVEQCIERINEFAATSRSKSKGVSEEVFGLADKLSTFEDEAVDQLIPLLKDPDKGVAQVAAIALRGANSIDEKYLPNIIHALDGDQELGWLVAALGRIDSPEAAEEAVKRYVGSKSAPHNQEAYALRLTGSRAIPFIIKAALCNNPCSLYDHYHLGHVIGQMEEETRGTAAKEIMKSLSLPDLSIEVKSGLIYMISFLKESALVVESQLLAYRENNTELSDVINDALASMSSHHAAEVLARKLATEPDAITLSKLSRMGQAGQGAGSVVLGLLEYSSWDTQVDAVGTLGRIGYKQAVPKLVELLNNESNVNLNWITVQSLGRLREKSSIPALKNIAKSHWYPPVRAAAKKAIKNIRTGKEYESELIALGSPFQVESCEEITLKQIEEDRDKKFYQSYAEEKIKMLSYSSEVIGFGADDEEEQLAADPDAIIEVRPDNMKEFRTPIDQIPDAALRVDGGWLAGSSRGEWGGELVYIADGQDATLILEENIEDIYEFGNRYIVTAGLAHLVLNEGEIYEISKTEDGWSYAQWRALPGAPYSSWLVETGELLVNTYGGGSVLISEDGAMRMAECKL